MVSLIKDKGFTLVEILIVILVLAVITGIAVLSYLFVTDRAKESAAESEMMNIAKALELYNTEDPAYPAPGDYPEVLEDGNYMDPVPINDPWENEYIYDSDGNGYTLESHGIDGANGGGDDIVVTNGVMTEGGAH